MMFKGSRKLDAGEASRILRELGAEENAFTSDDYTAYYRCWPATVWPWPSNSKPIAWPASSCHQKSSPAKSK